jgi:hypothetical protein
MQFFKPENYFEVRDALREAGRSDLIGEGCDCLIPSKPPKEAIDRRRDDANNRFRGEYVHTIPNAAKAGPAGNATPKPNETSEKQQANKKRSKKQQRQPRSSGKQTGVGYRPGRRV